MRIPIRKHLIKLILSALNVILDQQPYLRVLYKALIVTAYFGLFHIGELTHSDHVVKASDVHIGINKKKLLFVLRSSKTHCKGSKPQLIKISATPGDLDKAAASIRNIQVCPFSLLKEYLNCRKKKINNREQFFVFKDRSPVKPHHLRNILKQAIKMIGLNYRLYNSHGLRSGRSLDLQKAGISVETIKKLGRWKSNTVYTYLSNL